MLFPENDTQPGLVSILMPVRNAGPFLAECIDSIQNQTIADWELIAVNDHSEDDSRQILAKYARDDPRVRIFENEGKGIIPALRLALANASGALVTRMDADDVMAPQKLERMRDKLASNGTGYVALGLVEFISEHALGAGFRRYQEWLNQLTIYGLNYRDLYRECVIPSPCWMVFRSDLERAGGFTSERYPEDYDLCFRFYEAGLKCLPSDRVLHYWRDHPDRASRNDPNYADHTFIDLKIFWFLRLHQLHTRPLILWGAGRKGKKVSRLLTDQGVAFKWICNNQNKIGKKINGVRLDAVESVHLIKDPQFIIVVAGAADQSQILSFLDEKRLKANTDYFLFC